MFRHCVTALFLSDRVRQQSVPNDYSAIANDVSEFFLAVTSQHADSKLPAPMLHRIQVIDPCKFQICCRQVIVACKKDVWSSDDRAALVHIDSVKKLNLSSSVQRQVCPEALFHVLLPCTFALDSCIHL